MADKETKRHIPAREIAANKFLDGLANAVEHGSADKVCNVMRLFSGFLESRGPLQERLESLERRAALEAKLGPVGPPGVDADQVVEAIRQGRATVPGAVVVATGANADVTGIDYQPKSDREREDLAEGIESAKAGRLQNNRSVARRIEKVLKASPERVFTSEDLALALDLPTRVVNWILRCDREIEEVLAGTQITLWRSERESTWTWKWKYKAADPICFYSVNGKQFAGYSEHIEADRIIRFAGGSPETHELHQQGYEFGHPLTGSVDVTRFRILRMLTNKQAAAARLPGGFMLAGTAGKQ